MILLTRDTLAGIRLAEHPESPADFTLTPTPLIKNSVACVQFNNPPFLTGYEYVVHWTVFKVGQNGGDPCDGPNLFLGDLRAGELVHLYYYNGFTHFGDGDGSLGKYGKLYTIGDKTIMGVFNASNGLMETTYYQLVGDLPVVYINFTVKRDPRRTVFWYGINFINDIYVSSNPGETRWVEALGVGDYSFPAQSPQEMYNLAAKWSFKATIRPTTYTPGYWTDIYISPDAGNYVWMRINKPGVGKYYLALYPLTNIKAYYIASASGWAFNKIIGLVFANGTSTAKGALLLIYGKSLEEVQQNLYKALELVESKGTDYARSPCVVNPSPAYYLDNSSASASFYVNFTCAQLELLMGGGPMFGNLSTPGVYIPNYQSYFNHVVAGPYSISVVIRGYSRLIALLLYRKFPASPSIAGSKPVLEPYS